MSTSPSPAPQRRFIKHPDDKAHKALVAQVRSKLLEKDAAITKLTTQLNETKSDPKNSEERKELQGNLREVISKQAEIKQQRQGLHDQIKRIDAQLQKKITDLNLQTSKNNFKSVEEIDKKIAQLDSLVDSGVLRIVDERKTIKEMSGLRKLKKEFATLDTQQKSIDLDKAKIAELKKQLSAIQNKEVQLKFEEISSKLDKVNLENKSVQDKRKEIFKKRDALYKEKDVLYLELNELKKSFDLEYAKFKKLMDEERERAQNDEKLNLLVSEKDELSKQLENIVSIAKTPAFTEEINSIYNLLQIFDPSFQRPQTDILPTSSKAPLTKTLRTVEMPADVQIIKKEPLQPVGSKSKKGKKSSKNTKFQLEPTMIVSLSELDVPLPTSQESLTVTKEKLLEKLESFKSKQDQQTQENIANAEAEKKVLEDKISKLTLEIEEFNK